ncbi:hypothetical protein LOD99_9468 [Oopsacas minuta]|uniref:Uncharacterized protein n=1 Tax=Oopsacas minuta TaxID=111878 RepID=A0AAV7JBK0_9METZ|nr:hypothetical protein LOD99_9468 [Oopsacas minuta]
MNSIAEQESYFKEIQSILMPNWREQIRSGKTLLEIVDICRLDEVNIRELNFMLKNLTNLDVAQLKSLRMKIKDRQYRTRVSYNNGDKLLQEIQDLEAEKEALLTKRKEMMKEINFYLQVIQLDTI